MNKQNTHGGGGRGQGRKPVEEGVETVGVTLKMSLRQKLKLQALGGAQWIRDRIDRAREPGSKE